MKALSSLKPLFFFLAIVSGLYEPAFALYQPFRIAFPFLCENHFNNNIATKHTWLESEDQKTIDTFAPFLSHIPKIYYSDCYTCRDCWGLWVNPEAAAAEAVSGGVDIISDGHQFVSSGRIHRCRTKGDICPDLSWDGGYFRLWNKKYLRFFKQHLQYCSENSGCRCYWPEYTFKAVMINDKTYQLLKNLADDGLIDHTFSPYWIARYMSIHPLKGKIYGNEYYPSSQGMASSLVTYTFFYSQYHEMLNSVIHSIAKKGTSPAKYWIGRIYKHLDMIRNDFLALTNSCIEKHSHPKILYERGMLNMYSGKPAEAVADIYAMMHLCELEPYKNSSILTSENLKMAGISCIEVSDYDKAIIALTKAIEQDPHNSEAYFNRAIAYFEKGSFQDSIDDYLQSGIKTLPKNNIPSKKGSIAFMQGFVEGVKEGASNECVSVYSSLQGLCQCLWAFTDHPIDNSLEFADTCSIFVENLIEALKDVDWSTIEDKADELLQLCKEFPNLSNKEQGELIGRVIGKYGLDIFAGLATTEGFSAYKALKETNYIATLRALSNPSTKQQTETIATERAVARDSYFEQVTIHVDKQNKHVPTARNFLDGRSELYHPNPSELLKKYAGTGKKVNNTPGEANYKEIVDFGEIIGLWKNKDGSQSALTSRGTIIYDSKYKAHIVPAKPQP